jgi:hypothetical protein
MNEYVPSSPVVVPRPIPGMNTLAPTRGAPASLTTRPDTLVGSCAKAVETVRAIKLVTDKKNFLIRVYSPGLCTDVRCDAAPDRNGAWMHVRMCVRSCLPVPPGGWFGRTRGRSAGRIRRCVLTLESLRQTTGHTRCYGAVPITRGKVIFLSRRHISTARYHRSSPAVERRSTAVEAPSATVIAGSSPRGAQRQQRVVFPHPFIGEKLSVERTPSSSA